MKWKDWLALTFFPVEDAKELEDLRKLRSPFMVNISKCFQTGKIEKGLIKKICEKIVETSSSHRLDPNLHVKLEYIIFQNTLNETLKKEHEALGNFNMK